MVTIDALDRFVHTLSGNVFHIDFDRCGMVGSLSMQIHGSVFYAIMQRIVQILVCLAYL